MILGFKREFEDKKPTLFREKILAGAAIAFDDNNYSGPPKIHSMREGNRWKAGMAIQMAYGVRTPYYYQFNRNIESLSTCISTQTVFMTFINGLEITVAQKYLDTSEIDLLIQNDGLTYLQFINWFFPKDCDEWSGQIIHWTDFKY
jgi:hypothetical protein